MKKKAKYYIILCFYLLYLVIMSVFTTEATIKPLYVSKAFFYIHWTHWTVVLAAVIWIYFDARKKYSKKWLIIWLILFVIFMELAILLYLFVELAISEAWQKRKKELKEKRKVSESVIS